MNVKEVERLKIDLSTKDFVYPSSDIDPTFFCDKELMTELCKKKNNGEQSFFYSQKRSRIHS